MSFDPIAFAMGKAGMSRDVVSALMGGSGGGGGSGTLEESGWVKSTGTNTTVSGNLVSMLKGSSSHDCKIAPPVSVRETARFEAGDVVVVAFTVIEADVRFAANMENASNGTAESKTGLMTVGSGTATAYATETGSDVVTYRINSGYCGALSLLPASSGGASGRAYQAIAEVTGLKFNGTVIFGKV